MRELTLKEFQDFSLGILKDVHDFCVKNNLKYSLAYGTLIGAIRHKGFIPWDDDVDIIMPRPDYDRFCATYKSELFKVSAFEVDPDCRITYARVYDDNRTVVKTRSPWNLKEHGAWIDIFPLDAVEDDYNVFYKRILKINRIFNIAQFGRGSARHFSSRYSNKVNFTTLVKKILFLNGLLVPTFIKKVIKLSKKLEYGSTQHWGMTVFIDTYGIKDYHHNSLFEDIIDVDFEQYSFKSLKGYDEYLRNLYGDYMQLPPEKDRKPRQSYMHVYWKNDK